jgi:hypothetical protein
MSDHIHEVRCPQGDHEDNIEYVETVPPVRLPDAYSPVCYPGTVIKRPVYLAARHRFRCTVHDEVIVRWIMGWDESAAA